MADPGQETQCTAFEGTRRIASGVLEQVALTTKAVMDRGAGAPVLIFDDRTGEQLEVDFRGTAADVVARLAAPTGTNAGAGAREAEPAAEPARGPGRPKLGVVAREVTLLPRHWDWLNRQPGGASVALRKLVEDARRVYQGRDRVRQSQEAAYRFMSALAGNEPGFEEAARALFAGDPKRFDEHTASWPADVRHYARALAAAALTRD
jgi:hypothetical protein